MYRLWSEFKANSARSPLFAIFQFFAPQKIIGGLAPIWIRRYKLHVPRYRLVGKSFMKIRSAVPENGCLIFFGGQKKNKKKQNKTKNICKTYTLPPHRRLRKLPSLGGSVITRVCWLVRSIVSCELSKITSPDFHEIWPRCSASVSNFTVNLLEVKRKVQGQNRRLRSKASNRNSPARFKISSSNFVLRQLRVKLNARAY